MLNRKSRTHARKSSRNPLKLKKQKPYSTKMQSFANSLLIPNSRLKISVWKSRKIRVFHRNLKKSVLNWKTLKNKKMNSMMLCRMPLSRSTLFRNSLRKQTAKIMNFVRNWKPLCQKMNSSAKNRSVWNLSMKNPKKFALKWKKSIHRCLKSVKKMMTFVQNLKPSSTRKKNYRKKWTLSGNALFRTRKCGRRNSVLPNRNMICSREIIRNS